MDRYTSGHGSGNRYFFDSQFMAHIETPLINMHDISNVVIFIIWLIIVVPTVYVGWKSRYWNEKKK